MMMESSCFICGTTTSFSRAGPGKKKTSRVLKALLIRLCKLLSVTEVTAQDWEVLEGGEWEGQQQECLCCSKCFDLLKQVERLHEIILKTQRQLKGHLDQVETLIVKSEECQDLESSLWNLTCFDFRRSVLNKVAGSKDDEEDGGGDFEGICVKEEQDVGRIEEDDCAPEYLDYLNEDHGIYHDNYEEDNSADFGGVWANVKLDPLASHPATSTTEAPPKEEIMISDLNNEAVDKIKLSPRITLQRIDPSSSNPTSSKSAKKRKIEESRSEDKVSSKQAMTRTCTSRNAKKNAEAALKQQSLSIPSDDEDESRDSDRDYMDNEAANEDGPSDSEPEVEESNRKSDKTEEAPKRKRDRTGKRASKPFWPLLVAQEDLYLYRWDTFIRRTHTQLECKAHNCTFQTPPPFDYYNSFKLIKEHLEDKHRSRKHRQRTPHPCLLCNTLHKNRDELVRHLKAVHNPKFYSDSRAVCECCMATLTTAHVRTHAFSHKSASERIQARAENDCKARSLYPKESELTDKKYVCPHPGCTSAFVSLRNWKRHKNLHLPKQLRPDVTICPECGKCMLKECLATHMQRVHHPETVQRFITCQICDKRFMSCARSFFDEHMRRHKGEKPFLCSECGASYFSSAALTVHRRDTHGRVERKCEWCNKVYTKQSSWNMHQRRKHPDKMEKRESTRSKSKFYCNSEMEERMRKERFGPVQMFPCQICEKVLKFKFTLTKHLKSVHGLGR